MKQKRRCIAVASIAIVLAAAQERMVADFNLDALASFMKDLEKKNG